MTLTDYTSYAEIRATLGVSDLELEDSTLSLPLFSQQLQLDLLDIDESVDTMFSTVSAVPVADRTVDQKSFYAIFRLYSTYAVAQYLLTPAANFSFKRVSDGKAEKERFDPGEDVRDGIRQGFIAMGKRLKGALAKLDTTYVEPTSTFVVLARAVGLATNPVTGEAA